MVPSYHTFQWISALFFFFFFLDNVFFTFRVRLVERGAPQSLLLSESGKVISCCYLGARHAASGDHTLPFMPLMT